MKQLHDVVDQNSELACLKMGTMSEWVYAVTLTG